jgi:hypothetical protein
MKELFGCPITLGEYERVVKNLKVCEVINEEQKKWLVEFLNDHNYDLKNVVLKIEKLDYSDDVVIWVILNTGNSVKQFEE